MAFPTGYSGTSVLTTAIKPLYDADFQLTYDENTIWRQQGFVNWKPDMGPAGSRGSSIIYDVYDIIPPSTTALTELADKDPTTFSPGTVTLTPAEYGDVLGTTALAMTESYDDQKAVMAKLSGQQMAQSLDFILRSALLAGSWVEYPAGAVARTALGTTSHKISFAFITQVIAKAKNQQIVPIRGESFATVVNPLALPDVMADSTWLAVSEYQNKDGIFKGEVGELGGLAFISHRYGKLYLGGGLVAQAATTVATTAVAAGDTAVTVASGTGLSNGDYITLGTLEAADAERVQIVSGGTTTSLVVRGIGNAPGNFGCAKAHAVGAAVTEAPNVAAIPIFGKMSVHGVAGTLYGGKMGDHGLDWVVTNIPQRFLNAWWKWFGGYAIYEKHVIRAEVAVSNDTIDRSY